MPRPRREEFILDVRRSAKMMQKPKVEVDWDFANTDAVSRLIAGAAIWLTPKVVESYHPDDFTVWQPDDQSRLRRSVEDFRNLAEQVPPDKPATVEQFSEGAKRFRDLITVLGGMVLAEWRDAIDALEKEAEEWSSEAAWRSRRVNKKISESLLGTYEVPQLLIFAEPNLYVLDPVARFVPGAQGAIDFAIQPSYYTTSLYRDDSSVWCVHLDVGRGVANGKQVEWSKDAFYSCIEQLKVLV